MTLNHNEATATLLIDGLAICCFNHSTPKKWDLAFLHNEDGRCTHHLQLTDFSTSPPQEIPLPNPTYEITFEVANTQPLSYSAFPNGFFDPFPIDDRTEPPTNPDELENFRWVIDLFNPRDVPGVIGLKRASVRPTRVFLFNAIFYTRAISPKNLFRVEDPKDPNDFSSGQLGKFLFGRTNDLIGADILAPGGQVIIKVNNTVVATLPHRPGQPWPLMLTNLCVPQKSGNKLEKGDFHLFYDVLTYTPPKLVIWGEPRTSANNALLSNSVTGRTDCDTTFVSTSPNLDELFR